MTDIPVPEDRLRQLLDLSRAIGAMSITRADLAERIRIAGHMDLAAQVEAESIALAEQALSATNFLEDVLGAPRLLPPPASTDGV